jgi:uncharacterized protein (TIGR02117 family)
MHALRRVLRGLLIVVIVAFCAVVAGTVIPRPFISPATSQDAGPMRTVLLLSNPIHTDIAFPADPDVVERFAFLEQSGLPVADPGVGWIVAGWGGRDFYIETPTWAELKPLPLLKGLTIDRSVMHVALYGDLNLPQPGIIPISVGAAEFERMLARTLASFAGDAATGYEPIGEIGYGEYDRFYAANGYFSALVGCNTWTSAVLREGGLRTGMWNPMPQTLAWSLRLYNDLTPEAPATSSILR